jgi:hypothetical protein
MIRAASTAVQPEPVSRRAMTATSPTATAIAITDGTRSAAGLVPALAHTCMSA